MSGSGRMRVGTSGWSYDHWRGNFYPNGLPSSRWLDHYARTFDTVEINATFYRMPTERAVEHWRDAAPAGFTYAVKGSRYITHIRKLLEPEDEVGRFMDRMKPLGDHFGPLLWQLPPTMHLDLPRLDRFISALPRDRRHAIEFRHESWLADEVFELLERRDIALVQACGERLRTEFRATAGFVYARFHGSKKYHGAYSPQRLEPWASFFAEQLSAGRDCYAYFNNDAGGHAPVDALKLLRMLGTSPYASDEAGSRTAPPA